MNKKVKWYNNGIKEIQISIDSIIPNGFVKGRLPKPKKLDDLSKKFSKEKIYKDYIVDNKRFIDLLDEYSISKKDLRCLLTYYKIKKDLKNSSKNNKYRRTHEESVSVGKKSSLTQKESWNKKSEEDKANWSKKCSDAQINMSQEAKSNKANAYREWWFNLSNEERNEINHKRSNTLKQTWEKNGDNILSSMKSAERENRKNRLCRTVAEQKLFDYLITVYPDVVYDIRVDERYPYYCDFYIPSEDLFIELNAHPSHGRLPIEFLSVDEYSKYNQKWVDVFARRDIEKQKTAKENNLNYMMIYPNGSLEENLEINQNKNKDLIEKLYQTQK